MDSGRVREQIREALRILYDADGKAVAIDIPFAERPPPPPVITLDADQLAPRRNRAQRRAEAARARRRR